MERPSLCSAVRGGDTHWRRVLEIRLDPCARIVALAYYVAMTLVTLRDPLQPRISLRREAEAARVRRKVSYSLRALSPLSIWRKR